MVQKAIWDNTCIEIATAVSKLSKAERKQVGCVLVKDNNILSVGFNGTPVGWDNTCEGKDGKTLPEVLHAESNAIAKVAKSTQSTEGASAYITLSPCVDCAKLLIQAGIVEVFYKERYHDTEGLSLLNKASITTIQL